MHLADALSKGFQFFLSVCVFPGNWTHNLYATRCSTTESQEPQDTANVHKCHLTFNAFDKSTKKINWMITINYDYD